MVWCRAFGIGVGVHRIVELQCDVLVGGNTENEKLGFRD